jgi:DNA (cytosine-5)-methyltransferase 1
MGGFSQAMKEVFGRKAKCVWAMDNDLNAAEYFQKNFGLECFGDIRSVVDPGTIPDHDILFGGFPCQPFSRNGKWYNKNNKIVGEGEDRDNLFLELVKILEAKKPKYFMFENVPGLAEMTNKDGSKVLDTIVENLEGCGYTVDHNILNASSFGVPQQRKRIIFVGRRGNHRGFVWPLPTTTGIPAIEDILERKVVDSKYFLESLWKNRKIRLHKDGCHKVNHKIPYGGSRYQAIEEIYETERKKGKHPTGRTGKIESVAILYGDTPSGLPRQQDKIYPVLGLAPTIATFSTPCVDTKEGFRQLTPRECLQLQGFPLSFKLPRRDTDAYKLIGNAVCVKMIVAVLKKLVEEDSWKASS